MAGSSQEDRLVKLSDILWSDNHDVFEDDYIQVCTVWASDLKQDQRFGRFIFWDGEHHIGASINLKGGNFVAINICKMLQDMSSVWKIKHYKLRKVPERHQRLIRKEEKEIKLELENTKVEKISGADSPVVRTGHLPYDFTGIEEVQSLADGSLLDVIGYVMKNELISGQPDKNNPRKPTVQFHQLTLSGYRTNDFKHGGSVVSMRFYGDFMKNKKQHLVYAMLNVKVKECLFQKGKSFKVLTTTSNTIISDVLLAYKLNIKSNLLDRLLPKHCTEEYVTRLFPKRPRKSLEGPKPQLEEPTGAQSLDVNLTHPNTESTKPMEPPPSPAVSSAGPGTSGTRTKVPTDLMAPVPSPLSEGEITPSPCSSTASFCNATPPNTQNPPSPPPPGLERFPDKCYNLMTEYNRLKVESQVKLSSSFKDVDGSSYRMRSSPRGIALIINNFFFPKRTVQQVRQGSEKDLENLYELLTAFNFRVHIKQNVTSQELPNILLNFKACAKPEMDACFVAILSHGLSGTVEMVDGIFVSLPNDIIHRFDSKSFPEFSEKPKIFLIGTCQNVLPGQQDYYVEPGTPARWEDIELKNIIEIYAATEGAMAWRDYYLGSAFIYVFVDTLMNHAHENDLVSLLPLIHYRLSKKVKRDKKTKLYCKWNDHTFYKKLYFNPGL